VSKFNNKICSRHDIAEILLKLALNTNQSINQALCDKIVRILNSVFV
jgi:hypothetical protein